MMRDDALRQYVMTDSHSPGMILAPSLRSATSTPGTKCSA